MVDAQDFESLDGATTTQRVARGHQSRPQIRCCKSLGQTKRAVARSSVTPNLRRDEDSDRTLLTLGMGRRKVVQDDSSS